MRAIIFRIKAVGIGILAGLVWLVIALAMILTIPIVFIFFSVLPEEFFLDDIFFGDSEY